MATAYERLLDLGAPPLDDPMFYRIKFDTNGDVVVEIRETRARFGSDVVWRGSVPLTRLAASEVPAAVAAKCVEGVHTISIAHAAAPLVGDYGSTLKAGV